MTIEDSGVPHCLAGRVHGTEPVDRARVTTNRSIPLDFLHAWLVAFRRGVARFRRGSPVFFALTVALGPALTAHADPSADPANPFPNSEHIVGWYTQLPADEFRIPNQPGVWFLTPAGINCGIWFWGGFGCTGDIPGAPPGDRHIAWFNGNRSVHHGWTAAIQFPPGRAQRTLPPGSYVSENSTTCATTPQGETYCGHGEFKFLITPRGTWFRGWDDRRSYVCNAYGTCPPG